MKKILVISPHFSTGGAPQVTLNKIQLLNDYYEIKCVEYSFLASIFVVQRNQVIKLLGNNFIALSETKKDLIGIVQSFSPDIVLMEEFPEFFMAEEIANFIYQRDRKYKIFETTHDSTFDTKKKRWFPDKFSFVSAFSALKASVWDIPYEVIEYPIDRKDSIKSATLNLSRSEKHIVIVGLFTPRKNQAYAFQLANQLKDYPVRFHFIGNMAGNFENYWQPLLEKKGSNIEIWGERNDVDDFLMQSDLFLFPSRGDKFNKELNPIVIKEALCYPTLPKLMFNLDVYCNKYNTTENMYFLTGDVIKDTEQIVSILSLEKKDFEKDLVIIGTFPNTKKRNQLTKDCIASIRPTGRKIMLISHIPVSDEIQKLVDYYIYDAYNPLVAHSYYTRFFYNDDDCEVELQINGLKDTNQSLCVLTNLFNGFKAAKGLGYEKVFYITYDVVVDSKDVDAINISLGELTKYNAHFCTIDTPFGKGVQTTAMSIKVDWFLKAFDDVRNPEEYNQICKNIKSENFLEDYFMKRVSSDKSILWDERGTILENSGLGVSSHSEYYSVLPIKDSNDFMFFFYTYNIDDRVVKLTINDENHKPIFSLKNKLSDSRMIQKRITVPCEVVVEFFDESWFGSPYKTERYEINQSTIHRYKNTGWYLIKSALTKNVLPKNDNFNLTKNVKIIHLQTDSFSEREIISFESIKKLRDYGFRYIQHNNKRYTKLPPKENCIRPDCVSEKLFTEEQIQEFGTALTPAHYGCYESFKNAILTEFHSCDFLMLCEGDCILDVPIQEFVDEVHRCCNVIEKEKIEYMSFGDTKTLDNEWLQSETIEEVDGIVITDKIIGLQCIMFPKSSKDYLIKQLTMHKWDAADMYFNTIFQGRKMGIVKNRLTTQADGFSFIDGEYKIFKKK